MNDHFTSGNHLASADILQDRQGLKLASYLNLGTRDLPHSVTARLQAARMQALAQRKLPSARTASAVQRDGAGATLAWDQDEGWTWWRRVGAVLPLLALVLGLGLVQAEQNDSRARELAEVDAALLTDVLPPAAFADPGFVQFLKTDL